MVQWVEGKFLFACFRHTRQPFALRSQYAVILPLWGSQVRAQHYLSEMLLDSEFFVGHPLHGTNLVNFLYAIKNDGFSEYTLEPPPVPLEPIQTRELDHLIRQAEEKAGIY